MDGLVDSLHYNSSNNLVSFNAMAKPLKPGQVTALNQRLGDTWLTCLKLLIPLYPLYYIITRRTLTPWVTGFVFSVLIGYASSAYDTRLRIDVSARGYYEPATALEYAYFPIVSMGMAPVPWALEYAFYPITMGIGAMKAKRYARKRLQATCEAE
jgi:hypothetical protein